MNTPDQTTRAHNFCAGPCALPLEVLQSAQAEMVDYLGSGMSLIEMSHRSKQYDAVHMETIALVKSLFQVPDDFSILLLQGGATLQFSMVPMNLLKPDQSAAYLGSGSWASAAFKDAQKYGDCYLAWDGQSEHYKRMPKQDEIMLKGDTRYLHVTSNETIGGVRMIDWPELDVPLVADMSSDYISRPIPWERFDLVYGGAQKNLGPAGVTLVCVRKSILPSCNGAIGTYLRYQQHAEKDSLGATPPVFAIYMMGKVLKWMRDQGGLQQMERNAAQRASVLYDLIDQSGGWYRSPIDTAYRSHTNVVFRLPSESLEKQFLSEAEQQAMYNLAGHRSVGGCRASLYTGTPLHSVEALAQFMRDFHARNA